MLRTLRRLAHRAAVAVAVATVEPPPTYWLPATPPDAPWFYAGLPRGVLADPHGIAGSLAPFPTEKRAITESGV